MDMFKKGNVFKDHNGRGWFYGSFMSGLQKDNRVEIKVVKLNSGYSNEYHHQKIATKIDIVWKGEAIWEIDGEEISLKTGDFVIIPPGVNTRVKAVISRTLTIQTIKTPSDDTDKVNISS